MLKLIVPTVVLITVFIGGVLWRIDDALYSDRTQWLESQLRTQVQSLDQNIQTEIKFWQNLPGRDLKGWPQVLASAEVGRWEESWVWNEALWGLQARKEVLIRKLKSLPSPFLQAGNQGDPNLRKDGAIAFDVFIDQDQNPRGLVWIKKDNKIYVVINSLETWRNWLNAFRGSAQGSKATLFVMNSEGITLSHTQKDYLGQKMTDHPAFLSFSKKNDLQQLVKVFQFPDKKNYSVVAQRVPGSNLIVVATSPMGEILTGRSVLRWQILILGAGVLLLLIGGIIYMNSVDKQKKLTSPPPAEVRSGSGQGLSPAALAEITSEEKIRIYKSVAAAVGHELRGPLSSILANAQSIPSQDGNSQTALKNILKETREARSILDKVLGFSGQTVQDKIEMKLESPIRKIIKKWEANIKAKDIVLTTSIEDSNLVLIDQEPLMKAFENLIRNAIEAMDRKLDKQLTILVKADGPSSVVIIEDNGQGMYPDVVEQARDPFFTTRSFAHHLGLGLSEADGIFREHHAQMKIYSQPGKGTRVEVRFEPVVGVTAKDRLSRPSKGSQLVLPPESDIVPPPVAELAVHPPEPLVTGLSPEEAILAPSPKLDIVPPPEPDLAAPPEPDNINELFELAPLPLKPTKPPVTSTIAPEPVYVPLFAAESGGAEASKVNAPDFVFEKRASALDAVKVPIRRPSQRST